MQISNFKLEESYRKLPNFLNYSTFLFLPGEQFPRKFEGRPLVRWKEGTLNKHLLSDEALCFSLILHVILSLALHLAGS
jgi:hypothetical protein